MEQKAAQLILNEPVKLEMPAGRVLRLFGKKRTTLTLYPLKYGTMVKIASRLNNIETTTFDEINKSPVNIVLKLAATNAREMALMVAYGILNNRIGIALFARLYANRLFWSLTPQTGASIMTTIIEQSNVSAFLSTIISLRGLNVLAPKGEMSQNITGETIAPGASSAQQLNTTDLATTIRSGELAG
jgi:hypothetical protein